MLALRRSGGPDLGEKAERRSEASLATQTKSSRRLRRRDCLRRLGIRTQTGKDPETRFTHREFVELGVDAADVFGAAVVAALDLDAAHRQRLVRRLDGAELATRLRGPQEVEVDLDVEDLLHATHVGVAELLVRVEE